MTSEGPKHSGGPPRRGKKSEVRPSVGGEERRGAARQPSDATIEIVSPVERTASAIDVSKTGIQISLEEWLSAGTVCDLRTTTHARRTMYKRARVVWTRQEGARCVSGLEVMGSLSPPRSED